MPDAGPWTEPAALGLSLSGEPLPHFAGPVSAPLGHVPLRRAGSLRRTMSIDVHWPAGPDAAGHYLGRCRDALTTDPAQPPQVLDQADLQAEIHTLEIRSIATTPTLARPDALVGLRTGGPFRATLAEIAAEERATGAPLFLLLDDLVGASLVSNWTFGCWNTSDDPAEVYYQWPRMIGVCIGFRPGSSALRPDGTAIHESHASRVRPLPHPADPEGWHPLPAAIGMHFRRARSIDLWRDGDTIVADARFQDSCSAPDGGDRWAVHEYGVRARIGADGRILQLDATPGTLPYAPCRVAPVNNPVLIGTPALDLRETVRKQLRRTAGCTHLNDTLHALAEVPLLARHLPPVEAPQGQLSWPVPASRKAR